jgi:putative phosphoesterase
MRLAVIADIHGNLVALEAVLADLAERSPDAIVNLGDCATSPLWPRETVELLGTLSIPTVRGNHDRWLVEQPTDGISPTIAFTRSELSDRQREALAALPPLLRLDHSILAVHGTPSSDTEYLLEEAVDRRLAFVTAARIEHRLGAVQEKLVLCGHSHQQHFTAARGGRLILNPGSVGCPRSADSAAPFALEAGSPHARYAIATARPSGWSVELLALEYNWSQVAEKARLRNRADWVPGFLGNSAESGLQS